MIFCSYHKLFEASVSCLVSRGMQVWSDEEAVALSFGF